VTCQWRYAIKAGQNQCQFLSGPTSSHVRSASHSVRLISLCPAVITLDGAVLSSFIPLLVSAGLIVVSVKLPEGEAQHLLTVVSRPFVVIAAFPAVLMIVQILPLQFLANPIWTSVNAGFPRGITGSVSVDTGATAIALARYLSVVGAVVLAAAVASDRFSGPKWY
jgi:hypothetical protein